MFVMNKGKKLALQVSQEYVEDLMGTLKNTVFANSGLE